MNTRPFTRFRDRIAVVTGAASGIGRGLVEEAAERGMRVLAADLDEARLHRLREELALGDRLTTAVVDVSSSESMAALAEVAWRRYGRVHLLFNNAGVMSTGRAWEQAPERWSWLFGVNLMGVVHGIHHFLPRMLAEGEPGVVVNTASMAGVMAMPQMAAYVASKHAIVGLTETLQLELQESQSAVSAAVICPGAVRTNIFSAPPVQTAPTHQSSSFQAAAQASMDALGMDPRELAAIVFGHLQEGRFWIFPHPAMLKGVDRRARAMLATDAWDARATA